MTNIWQQLPKPIFALAPMEDVTDTAFRQIVARTAKPSIFFTEFANCDGIFSKGKEKVLPRLLFDPAEHPIVAQIWGMNPENFTEAARLIREMGFDGIDINMGCPQRKVVKHGACAALINNPSLAKEIIQATKEGAGGVPVSVKTRIGFNTIVAEEWLTFLLSQDLAALTVHGRTAKEMSQPPVHWDEIGKAVRIRNSLGKETVILGNGDIKSYEEGLEKIRQYGLDGVMIGRGIFENLWVFEKERKEHGLDEKFRLLADHARLFESTWQSKKKFQIMKKFFKVYVNGFDGASDLRNHLMQFNSAGEIESTLKDYLESGRNGKSVLK